MKRKLGNVVAEFRHSGLLAVASAAVQEFQNDEKLFPRACWDVALM